MEHASQLTTIASALSSDLLTQSDNREDNNMASIREQAIGAAKAAIQRENAPMCMAALMTAPEVIALGLAPRAFADALRQVAEKGAFVKIEGEVQTERGPSPRIMFDIPGRDESLPRVHRKPQQAAPTPAPEPAPVAKKPRAVRRPKHEIPIKRHTRVGLAKQEAMIEVIRANPDLACSNLLSVIVAKLGMGRPYVSALLNDMIRENKVIRDGGAMNGKVYVVADLKAAERKAAALKREQEAAALAEQAPAPQPIDTALIPPASIHPTAALQAPTAFGTLSEMVNAIAAQIAARIAGQITTHLVSEINNIASALPAVQHTAADVTQALANLGAPAQKAKRPRVLVLGLLPGQAGQIGSEFPQFDFSFVTSDELQRANKIVDKVDRVFSMTNFMSHALETQVKDHPGYVRVSGGMTSLRDALRRANQ